MKLELRYSNMGHRLNGILFFFFKLWFYLKGRERERKGRKERDREGEKEGERREGEKEREIFYFVDYLSNVCISRTGPG